MICHPRLRWSSQLKPKRCADLRLMKFNLKFSSGFSGSLIGWDAKLIVDGRGAFSFQWIGPSGPETRTKPRHDFGLTLALFDKFSHELRKLPSSSAFHAGDDFGYRSIRCTSSGVLDREYVRSLALSDSETDVAFDRIWFSLFALVRPVFLDLDLSADVIEQSR